MKTIEHQRTSRTDRHRDRNGESKGAAE